MSGGSSSGDTSFGGSVFIASGVAHTSGDVILSTSGGGGSGAISLITGLSNNSSGHVGGIHVQAGAGTAASV